MSLINEQYPLTTQDGKAIPLDIIKPSGLIFQDVTALAWSSLTIPSGMDLAMFRATEDIFVDLNGVQTIPLPVATFHNSVLLVPKGFVVASTINAGTLRAIGVSKAGRIYIQGIQKWAALSFPRQSSTIVSRN